MAKAPSAKSQKYDIIIIFCGISKEELPISIGNIKITWGKMAKHIADVVKEHAEKDFKESWFTEGFPGVLLKVEASGLDEALSLAFKKVSVVLDILCLTKFRSPECIPVAFFKKEKDSALDLCRFYEEGMVFLGLPEVKTEKYNAFAKWATGQINNEVLDASFIQELSEVKHRILRSLHWLRKARATHEFVTGFLMRWIAIECLLTGQNEPRRGKTGRIKERLNSLLRVHGLMLRSGYLDHLVDARNDIVHEAAMGVFDVGQTKSFSVSGDLKTLDFLHAITLQFVLTKLDVADLRAAWTKLEGYIPPYPFLPGNLPSYLYVMRSVRTTQRGA